MVLSFAVLFSVFSSSFFSFWSCNVIRTPREKGIDWADRMETNNKENDEVTEWSDEVKLERTIAIVAGKYIYRYSQQATRFTAHIQR